MNFSTHLHRINNVFGNGTKHGYWYLCCTYACNFFFNRPLLVRLTRKKRYQNEKKLLYTVMTSGYDMLNEIPGPVSNWDFVCYTDNPELKSDTWQIRVLKNEMNLDPVRLSRQVKINNHLVDSGYDISVYIDANFKIRGDLDSFVSHILPPGERFVMLLHPFHSSLREELELCISVGKDDEGLLRSQYRHYVEENKFKDPYPHIAGGMIMRRPGSQDIRTLMETWFEQLLRWSGRDQMAFNYSLDQQQVFPQYVPYWILRRYFKKMDHHRSC